MIAAARTSTGLATAEILVNFTQAAGRFSQRAIERFGRKGEW